MVDRPKGQHFVVIQYKDGDEIPPEITKAFPFKSFRLPGGILEVWYVSDGHLGRIK